jgi:pyruvate/2-oxoglutarate dehydrogenase complex dihydrolipoamide acyltransferase (E2) component
MPTKNPITAIGILAALMLVVGGVMLYLTPATQAPQEQAQVLTSPFKEPEAAPKPAPAAPEPAAPTAEPPAESPFSTPELTPEELAKLTPDERTRYDKMRESLQQVVQQVQALEQENTHLQQTLTQSHATNQALDIEIDKLRPPQHVAKPAEP